MNYDVIVEVSNRMASKASNQSDLNRIYNQTIGKELKKSNEHAFTL